MDEIFADMLKKGLVQFTKKHLAFNAFEFTKLVKIYDESFILKIESDEFISRRN